MDHCVVGLRYDHETFEYHGSNSEDKEKTNKQTSMILTITNDNTERANIKNRLKHS